MTKVVTYLFDNMFQGKRKISFGEKLFVVAVTALVISTAVFFVL